MAMGNLGNDNTRDMEDDQTREKGGRTGRVNQDDGQNENENNHEDMDLDEDNI